MENYTILILERRGEEWKAHVRDFPAIRVSGKSAESVYHQAAQAIRRELYKIWSSGHTLPRLHSYASVRIDDAWLREGGINLSRSIIRMVSLPPQPEQSSAKPGGDQHVADFAAAGPTRTAS